MPVSKLQGVALGYDKATLVYEVYTSKQLFRDDMQVGAESNLSSLTLRVRAILQLPFRASVLSTAVCRHVSKTEYKAQFCLRTEMRRTSVVRAGGLSMCVVLSWMEKVRTFSGGI